jgi:hypothetical protein
LYEEAAGRFGARGFTLWRGGKLAESGMTVTMEFRMRGSVPPKTSRSIIEDSTKLREIEVQPEETVESALGRIAAEMEGNWRFMSDGGQRISGEDRADRRAGEKLARVREREAVKFGWAASQKADEPGAEE